MNHTCRIRYKNAALRRPDLPLCLVVPRMAFHMGAHLRSGTKNERTTVQARSTLRQRPATARISINVNHVLILSDPLPTYHGTGPPLAKLFVANGRLVMGTSLGDKVVIVIALLLLVVVAVVSAEFSGIIRAARFVAAL